jgi:hypothetical protein
MGFVPLQGQLQPRGTMLLPKQPSCAIPLQVRHDKVSELTHQTGLDDRSRRSSPLTLDTPKHEEHELTPPESVRGVVQTAHRAAVEANRS